MKFSSLKFLLCFLVLVQFIACTPSDTPEVAVKEWLQGIVDQDGLKVEDRTCSARVEELRQNGTLFTALGSIGQAVTGEKPKYDISGVLVNVTKSEGDIAEAKITGRIRVAIGLSVQSQELNETWQIVREGGKWKVCQSITQAVNQPNSAQPAPTIATTGSGNSENQRLLLALASTSGSQPNESGQIYTVRADGSKLTQLTFGSANYDPVWSPDGKKSGSFPSVMVMRNYM